jgi:3-isopropylmalate/(R)-2-methylmalate dehydratase large subunit
LETNKPKNIIEKIWESHIVEQREGHPAVFAIDLMLIHEVTSAQAFQTLRDKNLPVFDTSRLLATLDHSIPTRKNRFVIYDTAAKNQVETLRRNCAEYGIPIYDFDSGRQGIVHVIGPELGATQPGMTIVCGDSHTSTHGAFGALAFGIGTSEVGHVLATGCLLQRKPKTMKVEFKGRFAQGVFSKDAILKLIADIGIGGGNGHIIEYCGEAVHAMSMEERMTVCNMSIECGARAGLIAPDETTYNYIEGRQRAPQGEAWERARAYWESLLSDDGATYDKEVVIDVSNLKPMVTWGTNPEQACEITEKIPEYKELSGSKLTMAEKALEYIDLEPGAEIAGVPIDWAFVGSCTNGRLEDLRIVASILKNQKISNGVTMYIVPGSEAVRAQAIEEGLADIFESAGADFRMPGCSMCLGMNDDKVPEGKRCISSSNRNFVGRQGPGSRTHLASPATVAASAVAGKIVSGESYFKE